MPRIEKAKALKALHRHTSAGIRANPRVSCPQRSLRRGGRAVDCTGLENRQTRKGLQGSNPCLSAHFAPENPCFPGVFLFPILLRNQRRLRRPMTRCDTKCPPRAATGASMKPGPQPSSARPGQCACSEQQSALALSVGPAFGQSSAAPHDAPDS